MADAKMPMPRLSYLLPEPLASGGPDAPSNMQWQTIQVAREKDKWEGK